MPGTPRKAAKAATATPRKAPVRMEGHKAPRKAAPRKASALPVLPDDGYNLGQAQGEVYFDLTMPSGQRCQARRPGVQGLIGAGILDSFDQLTALVQTEHIDVKATANQGRVAVSKEQATAAGEELVKDPAKMAAGFEMIDKMVVYVVTRPDLWLDYRLSTESQEDWDRRQARESHRIPVRNVQIGDKLFLVQWAVGGSSDLTAFREELGFDLDALESIKVLQQ